jgi:hypothetical protein
MALLPLTVSAAMAKAFSESDLPWKVDIVDWATTSESFRQIITRDRVAVRSIAERATPSPGRSISHQVNSDGPDDTLYIADKA